jgi:fructokinase
MNRIGIDLGGTKTEAIVLAIDGREIKRLRVASPQGDYAATIAMLRDLLERLEAETGSGASVGIGAPGATSPITGLHRNSNSTWINGRRFAADLEAALGRPIRLANDANCFALSEAIDGAGKGAAIVFGVILGTGTGGGIVMDRRVLTGANAIAGEWGHIPLPWPKPEELPGPTCYCGKFGCMETWVSGPAFAADFQRATGRSLAPAAIAAAAAEGDPDAEQALGRLIDRLARGLAVVVNVLDPAVIVLGGGLSQINALYAPLQERIADFSFSDGLTTQIVPALHGDSSGVRGAAWLWGGP